MYPWIPIQFWKLNINKIHIYEAVFLNPRKYNILKIYGHSGYQSIMDERKERKQSVEEKEEEEGQEGGNKGKRGKQTI